MIGQKEWGCWCEAHREALLNEAHLHPQELVNLPHPLTVTPSKVVIHSHHLTRAFKPLLDGLPDTLSPDTVMKLDDTSTKNIAAETEDSQIERARAIKKLKSLEAGLQTLNRFSRSKHAD